MCDREVTPLKEYRRRKDTSVIAIQLRLNTDGFTYKKWGGVQTCKPGDWLIDNGADVYSVDQETFARTYQSSGDGRYVKKTSVWARQTEEPGSIDTKEGVTHYDAGDYLVFNDAAGTDGYAISAGKFDRLYEPATDE